MKLTSRLPTVLIAGVGCLTLLLALGSAADGSTSQQSKFINAVHAWVPLTKHFYTTKGLLLSGRTICNGLKSSPVNADDPVAYQQAGAVAEVLGTFQDANSRLKSQLPQTAPADIVGMAVLYLCPSFEPGVRRFNQSEGNASTTNPETIPTVTAPMFIGDAAAAYKDGYQDAGGSSFETGTLAADCANAYTAGASYDRSIYGPTGAIRGKLPNTPTVKSNWVAGCIAGVRATNNNSQGYVNKQAPPTTTTTTVSSTPAPAPGGYTATQVCADVGQGQSGSQVVNDVESAAPVGAEPWGSAYQFVTASVASTCPQYTSVVKAIQHG